MDNLSEAIHCHITDRIFRPAILKVPSNYMGKIIDGVLEIESLIGNIVRRITDLRNI